MPLAFQAAGHLPGEGESAKCRLGVRYLPQKLMTKDLGDENSGQYMYFHGISSIALGELFGQTGDETLRNKLEKMIKVIVSSQNPQGGWRYKPISMMDISSPFSLSALRQQNGGIAVPQKPSMTQSTMSENVSTKEMEDFYQPGQGSGLHAQQQLSTQVWVL